jgi:Type II secretion system (T2SS), protein G
MKDLKEWGAALSSYYADFNFYPFNPEGPNAPIGPGIFLYDMFVRDKYIQGNNYLDGWNNNFCYSAGGPTMQTAYGYTIASLGKGNIADAPIHGFKCFQCDIRLRNGQFYTRPSGNQHDSADEQTCPFTSDCQ